MARSCRGDASRIGAAPSAAVVIARFGPAWLSESAAGVVRELVARTGPATPGRAKALLFAASRLVAFCQQRGVELSPAVVLSEASIERWVAEGTARLNRPGFDGDRGVL